MNRIAWITLSRSPTATRWGASLVISSGLLALLRLCSSSPICTAWATSAIRSMPPAACSACLSSGASSWFIQASFASTVSS